jgi:hypothetical protein
LSQRARATITVRIDKDILNELQELSRSTGHSLNSTINHLLSGETHWHLHATSAGFLYFPRMLVSDLASKLTDQEIVEAANRFVSEELKEAILMIRKDFNFKETLGMFGMWMELSDIAYRHEQIADNHILILGLRMGKKASLLLAEVMTLIFRRLGVKSVNYEITANAVILRVEAR